MKKLIGILAVAIMATTSHAVMARDLSSAEKVIIENAVKQQLKDPDSAKFYWQDYKGGDIYCAHVNAKNSYGGFSGRALIIAGIKTDSRGVINSAEAMIHSGDTVEMSAPICTRAGYQPN